jgi:hypothetical protein|tara:strand:+ start:341 stop:592 length:252 start_codon:yes stop_codon:yes gene_type:complete
MAKKEDEENDISLWIMLSPLFLIILLNIINLIYITTQGGVIEWGINYEKIINSNKEDTGEILLPSYFIIFFTVLFRLLKPYNN